MNKIKLFIASMLGAIALVFACVLGTTINAKTISSTFVFSSNLPDLAKYSNNTAPSADVTATDSDTNESMTLTISNYFTGGTIKYSSNNYLNRSGSSANEYAEFVFTTKGTGKLTLSKFTTQSDSKYATIILTRTVNAVETEIYNSRIAAKDKNQEYALSAAGTYDLKICGDSTQSSSLKFASMTITDTYDDGQAEATKYDVSYNNNGHGDSVKTINVSKLVASSLPELSAAGFNFGGWFYDNNTFENEAKVGDDITEATVLYAKWTAVDQYAVTYDIDGKTTSSNVNAGTIITLNTAPSKANAAFKGWSDGSVTYDAGASYTVNTAVTFTATWTTFVGGNSTSFVGSDLYGTYPNTISNQMVVNGTIFTIYADSSKTVTLDNTKITLSDGSTEILGRVKLGGTADFDTPLRVIGFTAPNNGTINVEFVSGSSNKSRNLILKDSAGTQIASVSNSSGSDAVLLSANVEKGKTYYIGSGDSGINIGKVEFVVASTSEIADSVTLAFNKQFDEDGSKATKLRFIGTIEGLAPADYKKIHSITFTFTFNNKPRTCEVTELYKSITGIDGFAAANNKLYFVYQLDHVNREEYKKLSLTNCKLTVVFIDDSSKELTYGTDGTIALPDDFDSYYVA
jgi:hypothetical protein